MATTKIEYGNKTDLNTTSVPDANKVKASDMNEIKSVVNNNADETTANTTLIDNMATYSTTETKIGTWNGQDLYRIIYVGGSYTANTTVNFTLNTSNIDKVIKIDGCFALNSTTYVPINFYNGNGVIRCHYVGSSKLEFVSMYSAQGVYISVEYTKTS